MIFAIPFPAIDPVLIEIGPFAIRWYALAYVVSLIIGWRYVARLAPNRKKLSVNHCAKNENNTVERSATNASLRL